MNEPVQHEPVLMKEVIDYLAPRSGGVYVDATVGQGGHSLAILQQSGAEGLLVGIDRDPLMLSAARQKLEAVAIPSSCYRLVVADHDQLEAVLAETLVTLPALAPDGFVFDLGPSTPQLLDSRLGMSWLSDQPLHMRLNPAEQGPDADEIVNTWPEGELKRIFREHADERWAGRIARRIVEARRRQPLRSGRQLGQIVAEAIPRPAWPPKIHPATRVFLGLRIEVNQEYRKLEAALPVAFEWLKPGGRLLVISFHSGEDRRVKQFMQARCQPPEPPWPLPQGESRAPARMVTRKPVRPGPEERQRNPRSRSAKLRVLEKTQTARPGRGWAADRTDSS